MGALRTYVRDEFKDKRQQEVDTSAWPISCAARQPCPLGPQPPLSVPTLSRIRTHRLGLSRARPCSLALGAV